MLRYKVKLNEPKGYNEIKYDELYLSPDLSFISGITDCNYELINGQHFKIEFNEDNNFHDFILNVENVTRQGYVILNKPFKIEKYNGYIGFRYVDGKFYVKKGNKLLQELNEEDNTTIVINGKTITINEEEKYVNVDIIYWIEDGKLTIGENTYNVDIQLDNEGNVISPNYVLIKGGKQLTINNSSRDNWKKVTKFSIRKKENFPLKINSISCVNKINDVWVDSNNGNFLHLYLYMPKYYFTSGGKILMESSTSVKISCNVIDETYIIYCGKKYIINDDTIDFLSIEGFEYKIEYIDNERGYIIFNNKPYYIKINGDNGIKLSQYKDMDETYPIIKYKYVTIDNDNFLVKNNIVDVVRKETYTLLITDVVNNSMLRCMVDVGEDGDINGVCRHIFANYKNYIFSLYNSIFEDYNVSKENFILALDRDYNEVFDNIKLFNPSYSVNFPLLMGNDMAANLRQEDILENIFFKEEEKKSINPYVDMEREIYYPYRKDGDKFSLIDEIKFDLHFRSRNLEDWKINDDVFGKETESSTAYNCNWNIFDYYNWNTEDENKPTIKDKNGYYQPADLLYFLNFTTDDVFYQKSKIGKSFLRLLFFDNNDIANQTLLYSCVVFMNENKLYKIYIDNIVKTDNNYVSVSEEMNETEILYSSNISVYNDTCVSDSDYDVTFEEDKRLAATFNVKNRYNAEESSEGFYLHIFKDFCEKLHEKTIYMKVEFNHAGEGRTINFTMPFKYDNEGNIELLDLSSSDLEEFKKGYPMKELYERLFIPINVVYDDENNRYMYYLPEELVKHDEKGIMKFNLYEIKIKDESDNENNN